jgi:hypothetical protein
MRETILAHVSTNKKLACARWGTSGFFPHVLWAPPIYDETSRLCLAVHRRCCMHPVSALGLHSLPRRIDQTRHVAYGAHPLVRPAMLLAAPAHVYALSLAVRTRAFCLAIDHCCLRITRAALTHAFSCQPCLVSGEREDKNRRGSIKKKGKILATI